MKLHERGSLFWWIIVIGMVTGWFGSDDDTKEAVVETAKNTTKAVVEKVEKASDWNAKKTKTPLATETETSYAEVARLKDQITSVIYESAVAEITAGNEVTLKAIWSDVNSRNVERYGATTSYVADFIDDNTAIVRIGGEKSVINFDADVGMVRNIEPFEESP